jgi:hypothetical protein
LHIIKVAAWKGYTCIPANLPSTLQTCDGNQTVVAHFLHRTNDEFQKWQSSEKSQAAFARFTTKETFVRYHKDSDGHILFVSRIDAVKDSGTSPSLW